MMLTGGTIALVSALAVPAMAGTSVVDETNLDVDWFTADTRPGGAVAFTSDHGAPTGLGTGALQLTTDATNAAKAQLLTYQFAGTALADVTDLAYWTLQHQGADVANASYQLQVDVDGTIGDGAGFTTLVFEPYWQNTLGDPTPIAGTDVWEAWDVHAGLFWSSSGVGGLTAGAGGPPLYTLGDVLEDNPGAVVVGIGVSIGTYNPDYVVATDGVTFGTDAGSTTFDFEPRPFTKSDCKDGGWETNFDPEQFKNQGDCVSYFASNGKTHGE